MSEPARGSAGAEQAETLLRAPWCINRKEDSGLGLPMKLVQERLGHSTINLTADVRSV
jgi:hypothetical protein